MRPWWLVPLLAAPWLNPMVQGPIPAMMQAVVTALCAVGFIAYSGGLPDSYRQRFASLVALSWLVAAAGSALVGLLQYFGVSAYFSPWISYSAAAEAYGNLRQRNQFATLLNIGMAVLVCGWPKPAARAETWLRTTQYVLAALLASAVAASASRTGLVQLLLLGGVALWWWRAGQSGERNEENVAPHFLMLAAVLAYGVALFVLPALRGADATQSGMLARLSHEQVDCSSRLVLWSNVLQVIAQKPWLGWGPGELSYAHFNTLYNGPRFCEILDNAHNLPLQMAVTIGVPATLALLATLCWAVWRAKPWSEASPERRMAWLVLTMIGLHSLLEYPLWYAPFQLAVLLCLLLLAGERWRVRWLGSVAAQLLASAVFAVCAYTLWDYWRISQIFLPGDQRAPAYQTQTLEKIQGSWLFQNQVRFAALGLAEVTPDNAGQILDMSKELLHYSPEAMVLEKLLDSARLLGQTQEIDYYRPRFEAAYPVAFAQWAQRQTK